MLEPASPSGVCRSVQPLPPVGLGSPLPAPAHPPLHVSVHTLPSILIFPARSRAGVPITRVSARVHTSFPEGTVTSLEMRGSLTDAQEESRNLKPTSHPSTWRSQGTNMPPCDGSAQALPGAPWCLSAEQRGTASLLLVDMGSTAGSRRSRAQRWLLYSNGLRSWVVICLCC